MSSDAAELLRTRGYAVFEDLLDAGEAAALRALIMDVVEELDPPSFCADPAIPLDEGAAVSQSGLVLHGIFRRRPASETLMLKPALVETLGSLLGRDARLEAAGAMVSDAARPFFAWHTHIDGADEGTRVQAGVWPEVTRCERVLALLYLDDIDETRGPLEVLPRRLGDPTAPPGVLEEREWPGRIELRPRAGTLVALEQFTWHCARSLRGPGHRVIAAIYAARRDSVEPEWMDRELASRSPFSRARQL